MKFISLAQKTTAANARPPKRRSTTWFEGILWRFTHAEILFLMAFAVSAIYELVSLIMMSHFFNNVLTLFCHFSRAIYAFMGHFSRAIYLFSCAFELRVVNLMIPVAILYSPCKKCKLDFIFQRPRNQVRSA